MTLEKAEGPERSGERSGPEGNFKMGSTTITLPQPPCYQLRDLAEARDHLRTIAYAAAEGANAVSPEVVILAVQVIARRSAEVSL